jgi:hypothetical protein
MAYRIRFSKYLCSAALKPTQKLVNLEIKGTIHLITDVSRECVEPLASLLLYTKGKGSQHHLIAIGIC